MATGQVFRKAVRQKIKARIALAGPSGSGKTYSALAIATGLGGNIAVIDTEHGSASLYADRFTFDVLELEPPFSPARYVESIRAAQESGYDVVVIDSLSHAWFGEGGTLDIAEANQRGGNKFAGWAVATPQQNRLVDAIIRADLHVIATMRSKTEWALNEKNQPQKIGLGPVQKDGIDYEFTVAGEMDLQHRLSISKSRFSQFQGQVINEPDATFGQRIVEELGNGLEGAGAPASVPAASSETSVGEVKGLNDPTEETPEGGGEGMRPNGPPPSSGTSWPTVLASPAQRKAIMRERDKLGWDEEFLTAFAKKPVEELSHDEAKALLMEMAAEKASA